MDTTSRTRGDEHEGARSAGAASRAPRPLGLVLRGFLMGAADVIPGVSGGTVALIVGVYREFIASLRRIDASLLRCLGKPAFYRSVLRMLRDGPLVDDDTDEVRRRAAAVAFLVLLGTGIVAAILTGARVIPWLLQTYPEPMRGLFFGLIAASAFIPFRMMRMVTAGHLVVFALGAACAFWIVGLRPDLHNAARGRVVLERPASQAGEAWVVPRDLLLGTARSEGKHDVYFRPAHEATWPAGSTRLELPVVATRAGSDGNVESGRVVRVVHGHLPDGVAIEQPAPMQGGADPPLWFVFASGAVAICAMVLPGISGAFLLLLLGMYDYILFSLHQALYAHAAAAAVVVIVFLAGIAVGLLSFSRVLHWLFGVAHDATLAALAGLMVGSLRRLWPFQALTGQTVHNVLPERWTASATAALLLCLAGALTVVALESLGRRRWRRSLHETG